jgi:hypothetical protein
VAEGDGFPRQLEAMLNEARGGGPRVEVLNFGVPVYNLDQEIEALRARALAFSPDLVVVAFCLNDLEGLFSYELGLVQDRAARGRSWLGRLREGLLGRSLLLSWIEYRLSELEARRSFARARNPLGGPLYAEAVSQQRAALTGKLNVLRSLLASRSRVVVVFPVLGRRALHRELHAARAGPKRPAWRPWTSSTATRPTTSGTSGWTWRTRAPWAIAWPRTRSATRCARGAGSARVCPPARRARRTAGPTSRRSEGTDAAAGGERWIVIR